ncbi:MAG: hypothetical protein UY81_C0030G0005 [Candidatus Giovannonibacteria bacterium GW2011_GWA2_53_7]|uniref:Uncharacterized protein n=1 Tax=Candidatus Giovannonibacteria bacterium GW2011_GWA2_53_7 TaxID=1618650 RepID=A0A0G2A643_9BACT|nr:MAG: hypothetical protein UY81_C0030G0005 [Candidatus Giovannonibacteria bacterium GW2011_GWA2_53_7]
MKYFLPLPSPLQKMTVITSALLACIALVLFAIIIPTARDVRDIRANLLSEQKELEERYQRGLLLKKLRADLANIQNDIALVDQAILTKEKSVAFITRLETLASAYGITHRLTLPLPEKTEKEGTIPVNFSLQWRGEWRALLRALAALEQEPYYLPITTIHITAQKNVERALSSFSGKPPPANTDPLRTPIEMVLTGSTLWKE